MKPRQIFSDATLLDNIDPDKPVLIAGPTASGKSALAMRIAESQGGVIVNADASQVYSCWRVLTARPSREEESKQRHLLYGHVAFEQPYSVGHWLRDVTPILAGHERAIVVGGTGLYFTALTEGLADIPATPADVRLTGNTLSRDAMLRDLDSQTLSRIDTLNRARVQRAWEVQQATGRGLAHWQDDTQPPLLPLSRTQALVFDAPKDWLLDRIARRFDRMIEDGALEEVRAVLPSYNPDLPAHRAIGVPELVSFLNGNSDLETARAAALISTRRFAKRQRTWFRSRMSDWALYQPART